MKKILYLVIPCTLDCIVFNWQELLTFFLAANTDGFPAFVSRRSRRRQNIRRSVGINFISSCFFNINGFVIVFVIKIVCINEF